MEISSAIEQFGDLKTMTMDEVTGRLKTHEERLRGSSDERDDEKVLLTRSEWIARGHGKGRPKSTVQCWNCQKFGHFRWDCPKRKLETNFMASLDDDPTMML